MKQRRRLVLDSGERTGRRWIKKGVRTLADLVDKLQPVVGNMPFGKARTRAERVIAHVTGEVRSLLRELLKHMFFSQ